MLGLIFAKSKKSKSALRASQVVWPCVHLIDFTYKKTVGENFSAQLTARRRKRAACCSQYTQRGENWKRPSAFSVSLYFQPYARLGGAPYFVDRTCKPNSPGSLDPLVPCKLDSLPGRILATSTLVRSPSRLESALLQALRKVNAYTQAAPAAPGRRRGN